MTEPDEVVPVRITVQLAGVGDVLAVEAAAMSQLERLEAQLGLPIAPEIVVAHTGDDERLTIGEERIALSSPDGPPEDAASRLRLALHRHRELLVTGAVAEAVARAWELPADGVVGGAQRFRAMLQEAVRRGLALRRLREAMSGLASPLSTETWLEAALAGLESPLVRLRLAPSLHATVSDAERVAYRPLPGEARDFNGLLRLMQDGLFYELGVPLRVAAEADPELPDGRFAVAWNDIASPPLRGLDSGCFLVNDTTTRLALLDIRAVSVTNPANGQLAAVAEGGAEAQRCAEAAGLTCWNPLDYVVLAAIAEIRRDIGALLTTRMTEYLLAKLGWASPDLVRAATERFDLVVLTRALRALIDEEITIRDLRTVLETLLSIEGTTTADPGVRILFGPRTGILMPVRDGRPAEALYPEELAECARAGLRRYLTRKYTRGANILPVHLMDHGIEALVAANDGELPEPDRWAIATAVRAECAPQSEAAGHAVILTALYVRRGLRAILRHNLPRVAVLSYAELFSPGLNIYPISRISLS